MDAADFLLFLFAQPSVSPFHRKNNCHQIFDVEAFAGGAGSDHFGARSTAVRFRLLSRSRNDFALLGSVTLRAKLGVMTDGLMAT